MNSDLKEPSKPQMRVYARNVIDEIFMENIFNACAPPPSGTLRGIDVLDISIITQKLSRAVQIYSGKRHRLPNLIKPTCFYEKLVMSKFFAPIPMPSVADKLSNSSYIPNNIVSKVHTFEVIWSGNKPIDAEQLDNLALPDGCYYAKSNCGSGSNISFRIPISANDLAQLTNISAKWLTYRHGVKAGEWWYDLIRPQLFIERNYAQKGQSLTDWKFHVGGGRVLAIQVDEDRQTNHKQLMYDRNFRFLSERMFFKTGRPIQRPQLFNRMVNIAETIGAQFEYIRVDLYVVADKVYLGELTLAPLGGQTVPISEKLDHMMGSEWQGGIFSS